MPRLTVRPRTRGFGAGFTLLEAVIATALVGLGVVALMVAMQTGTHINGSGQEMTQACFLVEEVREYALKQPWGALTALNDSWSPPRNADGAALPALAGWTQTVSVEWRNANDVMLPANPGTTDLVRITVTISHQGQPVLSTGWLRAKKDGET